MSQEELSNTWSWVIFDVHSSAFYQDNLDIFPRDKPGFLTYFYPFYSEEDWYAPIAALKVNTTDAGVVLCQVHGKNIEVTETFRLNRGAIGKARIEIQP